MIIKFHKIYDYQETSFLSGLSDALERSHKADVCAFYFNLRSWKKIADFVNKYKGGKQSQCRLLLGMYAPDYQLRQELMKEEQKIDNKTARKLRNENLVNKKESKRMDEKPRIVCSMGLIK